MTPMSRGLDSPVTSSQNAMRQGELGRNSSAAQRATNPERRASSHQVRGRSRLPARDHERGPGARRRSAPGRRGQGAMSRILVVEDEPRIESFLRRALTSCGFDVTCVPNGETALEACEREPYDLVLLDLLLPGLDGFSFLERVYELRPEQEVLVLSALSDVESKVRCFELAAADYVTKPFVLAELMARIRTRVRHSRDFAGK